MDLEKEIQERVNFKMNELLTAVENTAKANTLLISKSILVMFPEKKRGAKTKKFFTHCSTRSSFKYFVIRIKEYHKISDFKIKKSAEADLNIMILIWSFIGLNLRR